MRFRNYINGYSRRNRIFSDEDLLRMTLANLFDNEQSILAQNSTIGIPSYNELELSPNTQWIEPFKNEYDKDDGGYWQSILTPEYQESYAPGQSILNQERMIPSNNEWEDADTTDLDEYLNKNIIDYMAEDKKEEFETNKSPQTMLEGNVQKNIYQNKFPDMTIENSQNKTLKEKYDGLRPIAAIQKALSKVSGDNFIENEYYRNSLKMNDGEPLTDKFLEENDIFTLKDITDPEKSKYYKEQLAKMYNFDMNDPDIDKKLKNKKIVVPKESSRLYQYAKNSEAIEKWIVDNYDKIKNGEKPSEDSIEFPMNWNEIFDSEKRGMFATIHNANMRDMKVNPDGSISGRIDDPYNYEKWKLKHYKDAEDITDIGKTWAHNMVTRINNRAYEQQQSKQLEDLYLSMPFNLTEDEIKKLKKKYGRL